MPSTDSAFALALDTGWGASCSAFTVKYRARGSRAGPVFWNDSEVPEQGLRRSFGPMTEAMEPSKVNMDSATAAALVKQGGNLYVWAEELGMPKARTEPPARAILYETIYGEGWSVHIDREIEPPSRWVIKRKRLPWLHFEALYDPLASGWSRPTLGGLIEAIFGNL